MAKRGRPSKKDEMERVALNNPDKLKELVEDAKDGKIDGKVFGKPLNSLKVRAFRFISTAKGTQCDIADKKFGYQAENLPDMVEFTAEEIEKFPVIQEYIKNAEGNVGNNKLIEVEKVE